MELSAEQIKTLKDTPALREEYRELRTEAEQFGLVVKTFDSMVETEIQYQDLIGKPRDWVYCGRLVLDTLYGQEFDYSDDLVIGDY